MEYLESPCHPYKGSPPNLVLRRVAVHVIDFTPAVESQLNYRKSIVSAGKVRALKRLKVLKTNKRMAIGVKPVPQCMSRSFRGKRFHRTPCLDDNGA